MLIAMALLLVWRCRATQYSSFQVALLKMRPSPCKHTHTEKGTKSMFPQLVAHIVETLVCGICVVPSRLATTLGHPFLILLRGFSLLRSLLFLSSHIVAKGA